MLRLIIIFIIVDAILSLIYIKVPFHTKIFGLQTGCCDQDSSFSGHG